MVDAPKIESVAKTQNQRTERVYIHDGAQDWRHCARYINDGQQVHTHQNEDVDEIFGITEVDAKGCEKKRSSQHPDDPNKIARGSNR